MRGLAALYVVLGHVVTLAGAGSAAPNPEPAGMTGLAYRLLDHPHYAVAVFIVLSGFCLMLPVTGSPARTLQGGVTGFLKRRARRILPPYYAALAAVIIIHLLVLRLTGRSEDATAHMSAGNIVSHLLLLHNLVKDYNMSLNAPMWSVAWEWQIYFIFALILLPIWRRFGVFASFSLAMILSMTPVLLMPAHSNLVWTCPWYVGLFALGMYAAEVSNSNPSDYLLVKSPVLCKLAIGSIPPAFLLFILLRPNWLNGEFEWILDFAMGIFIVILIVGCIVQSSPNRLLRGFVTVMESKPLARLGAFSYSLYLIHAPLLHKIHDVLNRRNHTGQAQFAFLLFAGVPLCLMTAYVFHLAFERPFMSRRQATPAVSRSVSRRA